MKKIILFFAICLMPIPLAFAGTNKCNDMRGIHCVYYTGNQSGRNGKYVKSTFISNEKSNINCTRSGFSEVIPQLAGNGWGEGKKSISYEQCLNAECKSSKHLGIDTFTIVKNDQGYISHPHYFKIRLLSNYGASCTTWK